MVDFTFFVKNDGGRAAAGYTGVTGDCVCRAVAIATGLPYQTVYDAINEVGRKERITRKKKSRSSARTGVYKDGTKRLMALLRDRHGIEWRWVPTMQIGTGCKVHVHADELPAGRLILNLSRHMSCMIDGMIHDLYDPSRNGTRCVYGYYEILKGAQ